MHEQIHTYRRTTRPTKKTVPTKREYTPHSVTTKANNEKGNQRAQKANVKIGNMRKECFPLVAMKKSGVGSASAAVGTLRQRRTKRLMLGVIQLKSMDCCWDEVLLVQFPAMAVVVVLAVDKSSLCPIPENVVSHAAAATLDD